jgi:hypothetical protein
MTERTFLAVPNEATFPYSEKLVAEKLSVPRREVRAQRDTLLEAGVDWKKDDGGAVMLSEHGVVRLILLLGIDASAIDIASLKKNGAVPPAEPEALTIVAICPNPRMVLANEAGEPSEPRILVDVGRNRNFAIGDVLEVTEHETQQGVKQLVSKCPATARRPSTNESLRAPGADWGRVEAERIRKTGVEHRRNLAARKK